jgi:hypothetical protein
MVMEHRNRKGQNHETTPFVFRFGHRTASGGSDDYWLPPDYSQNATGNYFTLVHGIFPVPVLFRGPLARPHFKN